MHLHEVWTRAEQDTVTAAMARSSARFGARVFLYFTGDSYTYADIDQESLGSPEPAAARRKEGRHRRQRSRQQCRCGARLVRHQQGGRGERAGEHCIQG